MSVRAVSVLFTVVDEVLATLIVTQINKKMLICTLNLIVASVFETVLESCTRMRSQPNLSYPSFTYEDGEKEHVN